MASHSSSPSRLYGPPRPSGDECASGRARLQYMVFRSPSSAKRVLNRSAPAQSLYSCPLRAALSSLPVFIPWFSPPSTAATFALCCTQYPHPPIAYSIANSTETQSIRAVAPPAAKPRYMVPSLPLSAKRIWFSYILAPVVRLERRVATCAPSAAAAALMAFPRRYTHRLDFPTRGTLCSYHRPRYSSTCLATPTTGIFMRWYKPYPCACDPYLCPGPSLAHHCN
ncbi:hypothetical protein BD779DRAFT_85757 [Infundibulicybe gibba]|nr:hypothetical protein BD779DRAFT_85757 [Infundibulicybe gibba]